MPWPRSAAFFREHYSIGEEGLRDLDRVGLATMALHSVRVFTNMCRRLLPERGIWDRLKRGALRTDSAALTTLHLLLALALRRRRTRHQRRWRAFDREAIALERKIEALEQRKQVLDKRRAAVTREQDRRAAKTSASPGPGDPALAEEFHAL